MTPNGPPTHLQMTTKNTKKDIQMIFNRTYLKKIQKDQHNDQQTDYEGMHKMMTKNTNGPSKGSNTLYKKDLKSKHNLSQNVLQWKLKNNQ